MILTEANEIRLESRTLPGDRVREMVREYCAKTQIPQKELARRIGYGTSTLNIFMADNYVGNVAASDARIRVALTDFMAAHPISTPEGSAGTLYETENVKRMRRLFDSCLRDRAMAFCYGAPGSQKTWVMTKLVAEHNFRELPKNGHGSRAYIVYCSEGMSPRELLRKLCRAAVLPAGNTIQDSLSNLRWDLRTRRSLFILDEAQHLPIKTLEYVRELNDCEPHCGILLTGSHRLAEVFRQKAAELEQWNSRLAAGVHLPGMTEPEAISIIASELGKQTPEVVQRVVDTSRVADAYYDGPRLKGQKVYTYISARRLFHQLAAIVADPRFAAAQPAEFPEGATA